ncbi:GRIM REAPER [Spatholobus suberectus]|nr:GRIM REAPER [Spatholobus suberectus]
MSLTAQSVALVTMLLLLLVIKIEGNSTPKEVHENGTSASSSSLMKKDENQIIGCAGMPLICSRGEFPPRSICCGDHCVDVTTDRDNCGLCGFRCPLNRQCCNRFCTNTNLNIFNCGRCGRVCPVGRLCIFGLCAYEQAVPVPVPVSPSPLFSPVPPELPPAMD